MATTKKTTKKTTSTKTNGKTSAPKSTAKPKTASTEKKKAAEKKEKLPYLKAESVKWKKVLTRMGSLITRMEKAQSKRHNPDLVDAIDSAKKAAMQCEEVCDALEDGDDSYRPTTTRKRPEVGNIVCLTEKGREKYDGLLEKEEFSNLEVLRIKGSTLIVRSKASEEKFKIPRGQVRIQTEKAVEKDAA